MRQHDRQGYLALNIEGRIIEPRCQTVSTGAAPSEILIAVGLLNGGPIELP